MWVTGLGTRKVLAPATALELWRAAVRADTPLAAGAKPARTTTAVRAATKARRERAAKKQKGIRERGDYKQRRPGAKNRKKPPGHRSGVRWLGVLYLASVLFDQLGWRARPLALGRS